MDGSRIPHKFSKGMIACLQFLILRIQTGKDTNMNFWTLAPKQIIKQKMSQTQNYIHKTSKTYVVKTRNAACFCKKTAGHA